LYSRQTEAAPGLEKARSGMSAAESAKYARAMMARENGGDVSNRGTSSGNAKLMTKGFATSPPIPISTLKSLRQCLVQPRF